MSWSLEVIRLLNQSFHMRVEPLGTNQGLASVSGSYYSSRTCCVTPPPVTDIYLGDRTSEEYADHRNPEDKEECDIVQLWSGYQACINSSGAPGNVSPAIGRGRDIQVNSAIFMFHGCLCLGGLLWPQIQTGISRLPGFLFCLGNCKSTFYFMWSQSTCSYDSIWE